MHIEGTHRGGEKWKNKRERMREKRQIKLYLFASDCSVGGTHGGGEKWKDKEKERQREKRQIKFYLFA